MVIRKIESHDNCYECKKCKDYWFSKENDLKKIKCCPECGETDYIIRKENPNDKYLKMSKTDIAEGQPEGDEWWADQV